ncbi:MAG: C1 family peptidase [Pyrinomonadaceae bacterium]
MRSRYASVAVPAGAAALALSFIASATAQSPTPSPAAVDDYQQRKVAACTAQEISGERTYAFRTLPREPLPKGFYGKKPWLLRVLGWVPGVSRLAGAPDESAFRSFEGSYPSRTKPFFESSRSRAIRLEAEARLKSFDAEADAAWQRWLAENPKADDDAKLSAESRLRTDGLALARAASFDWRAFGIDVGPAGNQGYGCNLCWAFAAVDAVNASRQIMRRRRGIDIPEGVELPPPSVRQLVSCMGAKAPYCIENWPSEAFTFMVDQGLPLGGSIVYVADPKTGPICDPDDRLNALTWDYVAAAPGGTATADEIKRALVMYGPVVAAMNFDSCLELYDDGIFNEEVTRGANHFVLIIGWSDDKQAWLVKNSWGTDWGDGGFGWIKYQSNLIGRGASFVIPDPVREKQLIEKYKNNAQ